MQVLVSHIGTVFECGNLASLALEDFGSDTSLNFKQFESYLSREVFSSLSDSLGRRDLSLLEKQIDQICWNLSKSKLILDSVKRNPRLGSESTFKLFRLFCLLGDLITDADTNNAQVGGPMISGRGVIKHAWKYVLNRSLLYFRLYCVRKKRNSYLRNYCQPYREESVI